MNLSDEDILHIGALTKAKKWKDLTQFCAQAFDTQTDRGVLDVGQFLQKTLDEQDPDVACAIFDCIPEDKISLLSRTYLMNDAIFWNMTGIVRKLCVTAPWSVCVTALVEGPVFDDILLPRLDREREEIGKSAVDVGAMAHLILDCARDNPKRLELLCQHVDPLLGFANLPDIFWRNDDPAAMGKPDNIRALDLILSCVPHNKREPGSPFDLIKQKFLDPDVLQHCPHLASWEQRGLLHDEVAGLMENRGAASAAARPSKF